MADPLAYIAYPALDPVLIAVGPVRIHWYGVAYVVGLVAAGLIALWLNKRWEVGLTEDDIVLGSLWAIIAILVGARLGYVLFYGLSSYLAAPMTVFAVWDGGMSFHGGAVGLIIAGLLFSRRVEVSFLRLADIVVVGLPVGILLGRVANFVNNELWGRVTDVPWAFVVEGYPPRHASQLYEAALEGVVILVVMLLLARRKRPDGFMFGTFLMLYGVFRFTVEFFRQPDQQLGFLAGGWLTMGMLLSVPLMVAGVWLIVRALRTGSGVEASTRSD
jgi:phosphatidylglycerol:prolipoprotein diacylglycerol transferase